MVSQLIRNALPTNVSVPEPLPRTLCRNAEAIVRANGHQLPKSTRPDGTCDGDFGAETEREVHELTGSRVVDGAQWKKLLGV
jgi:hypothetical protein